MDLSDVSGDRRVDHGHRNGVPGYGVFIGAVYVFRVLSGVELRGYL